MCSLEVRFENGGVGGGKSMWSSMHKHSTVRQNAYLMNNSGEGFSSSQGRVWADGTGIHRWSCSMPTRPESLVFAVLMRISEEPFSRGKADLTRTNIFRNSFIWPYILRDILLQLLWVVHFNSVWWCCGHKWLSLLWANENQSGGRHAHEAWSTNPYTRFYHLQTSNLSIVNKYQF